MKYILTIVLVLTLVCGCSNRSPKPVDVLGKWRNLDGAELNFQSNGTFVATGLPVSHFWNTPESKKKFNGSGHWKIKHFQSNWLVDLVFANNTKEHMEFDTSLILARDGDFGNGPHWLLFIWKEEEGGDRYSFQKVPQ
jgi:hypothetical protein